MQLITSYGLYLCCMEEDEIEKPQQEEQRLVIYSKTAILVFSIFFSPIGGAILLMLNLRRAGRGNEGGLILFFAVIYQFVAGRILSGLIKIPKLDPNNPPDGHVLIKLLVSLLIPSIIGGGILAEYFFKKYFPDDDYERRNVGSAILVAILISIPLSMLLGI